MKPTVATVKCPCGRETDSEPLVVCPKCKQAQHQRCVNFNKFSDKNAYRCPSCQHKTIACFCGKMNDYTLVLIQCSSCKKYFHKRHVGIPVGSMRSPFVCPNCTRQNTTSVSFGEPRSHFAPQYSVSIKLMPLIHCRTAFPRGYFTQKIAELTAQTSVISFIQKTYYAFRSLFWVCHPSFLDFPPNFRLEADLEKAYAEFSPFHYFYIEANAFCTSVTHKEVVALLSHIINLDIYKRPCSRLHRSPPQKFLPMVGYGRLDLTERAEGLVNSCKAPILDSLETPHLMYVTNYMSVRTVVTNDTVQYGSLICEVYGVGCHLEEVETISRSLHMSTFRVLGLPLFVKGDDRGIFCRINRGYVSNCLLRVFLYEGQRRIGIFATKPTPLFDLIHLDPTNTNGELHAGTELVLPFENLPIKLERQLQWINDRSIPLPEVDFSTPRVDLTTALMTKQILTDPNKNDSPMREEAIVIGEGDISSRFDEIISSIGVRVETHEETHFRRVDFWDSIDSGDFEEFHIQPTLIN